MKQRNISAVSRRTLLAGLMLSPLLLGGCQHMLPGRPSEGRVVIIGGGFGGATAARLLRQQAPQLDVTLVERANRFYTCPFSNLVLAGLLPLQAIAQDYATLIRAGVRHQRQQALDIDPIRKQVILADGTRIEYDRLIVSPGIDLRWDAIEGYDAAAAEQVPHAWKAGPQTLLLRRQLEAMPDGGSVIISVPANPYRCPPGPYERASLIAHYLSRHKPRSKVLILDSKDRFSKQALFTSAWKDLYGDRVEWIGLSDDGKVVRVDPTRREVETDFSSRHRAAVLNVIPPQQAGRIAVTAGLTDASGWVPVDPHTFESRHAAGVHVIGDACIAAPMPKSGFAAGMQARAAVAAIIGELTGQDVAAPQLSNICYSLIKPEYAISVAGQYEANQGALVLRPGTDHLSPLEASPRLRQSEARSAESWYRAATAEIWGH
ncbi:NAD(P)/FAD-dependent oxidoreductase [Marinobacterium sp. MBR-109]|uniref:NAD(P)/FAD-dependent oxidoreductase n=1 Tax=Marinobacterium sp. MBR-109 TaxID=3156462 RepID=UPI0033926D82